MTKRIFMLAMACVLLSGAAWAQNEARAGSIVGGPVPAGDPLDLTEGFDDITTLPGAGWALINNSAPLGVTDWFQGNAVVFPAQAGAPTAYIGANFNNTAGGAGIISNWLLTPELPLSSLDQIVFWTRTVTANTFPDRMEVRMSLAGASTDVGATATDVGDFTDLLLEINPTLAMGGYPDVWTQFTLDLPIMPATTGRIAFRYFVTSAGPAGSNSNYIGIDTFDYIEVADPAVSALPIPTMSTVGFAVLALLLAISAAFMMRRRKA